MSLWCLGWSKIKCSQVSFKRCDRWRKSNGQWYWVPNVWRMQTRWRRVYQWMFLWVVELGEICICEITSANVEEHIGCYKWSEVCGLILGQKFEGEWGDFEFHATVYWKPVELAEQLMRGRVSIIEGNFSCEILDPLKFIDIEDELKPEV